MSERYKVIETKNKADYEYILVSPSGEELSGGDGLHNETKMQLSADLLNKETDWLFAEIEAQKIELTAQVEALADMQAALQAQSETIAALRKDNTVLQGKLDDVRDKLLANSPIITGSSKSLGMSPAGKINVLKDILGDIFNVVKHQYGHIQIAPVFPVPQDETTVSTAPESPTPRFKVGDKVRWREWVFEIKQLWQEGDCWHYAADLGRPYSTSIFVEAALEPYSDESESE